MDRLNLLVPRVGPSPAAGRSRVSRTDEAQGDRFAQELEQALGRNEGVRFSAHAQQRLDERGLNLQTAELVALERAVDTLESKGGHSSLVLTDRAALVVNVDNRTVITAVDRQAEAGRVFTNIDSAVVI